MNLSEAIRTVRWMIADTFRQSLSTRLFWVTLAITAVCTLLCASVRVSGDPESMRYEWEVPAILPQHEAEKIGTDKAKNDGVRIISGEMTLGFGAVKVPIGRSRDDSVRLLSVWLAGALADTVGVLLALLWTAGFIPTFLEPQSATVLLAKPAPRWSILLGKYLGVVGFVALQAFLFVGGTWSALGMATGVWNPNYWLAVPLLVLNFGIFFSVSTFLAVCSRSTVVAAFGTLLFWLLCWAMNFSHHRMLMFPNESLTPISRFLLDVGYWSFPKPLDLSSIFFDAMHAENFVSKVEEMRTLQSAGKFSPEASIATSVGFAAVVVGLSAYELEMTDY